MSCGPVAFAPAATRINSSPVSCVRLMGSWPCLLFGRFAACSAGDATTGSPCTAQHEHSDSRLRSHIERPLARTVQASLLAVVMLACERAGMRQALSFSLLALRELEFPLELHRWMKRASAL